MTTLPAGHHWVRLCHEDWENPLDPTFAQRVGGRWNPPDSWPTLHLNADLDTARANLRRLLDGQPVDADDLGDDAPFEVMVATLPTRQPVEDLRRDDGLARHGLPASHPLDDRGELIGHDRTQPIGEAVHAAGLRGVWCRSAATPDGSGTELAWFPARGASATQVGERHPFRSWRDPLHSGVASGG